MNAPALGVLLALVDVLVIGIGLAFAGPGDPFAVVFFVSVIGMLPAVVVGALLGWLGEVMGPLPVWLRRFVLVLPALLLVIVLGAELSMQEFILVSCIPTTVAALVLERATREREAPPIPVAVLHRSPH